jgi:hypothetical protein
MQLKSTVNFRLAAGLALALALTVAPRASADDPRGGAQAFDDEAAASSGGCSDRTVRGDYAFAIEGTILTPASPILVRGVAMTHFDGHGNLSQVDFVTLNGAAPASDWRPATGTYEINSDCTGTAQINPAGAPPLNLRLVVGARGRQIWTVVIGNSTGSTGTRVR